MRDKINNFIDKFNFFNPTKEEKEIIIVDYKKGYHDLLKENEKLKLDFGGVALHYFKNRRSIRKFNHVKKVEFKHIFEIIEAGLNAPCAGNIQNYRIVVISDLQRRKECANYAYQQTWVADAPYILAIVRDNTHVLNLYPDKGELYSIQNVAALIENIILMAHFNGLGACWVGIDDEDNLKSYLGVPNHMFVDALIPIGYSLENPSITKNPANAKVDFEKYGSKTR